MSVSRREYLLSVNVNGLRITRVVIDPHYEVRHSKAINDQLIIKIVQTLDDNFYDFSEEKNGYEYFVNDAILFEGKKYRLIWLLERNKNYIGVINIFRSSK